ncbi:hypothetical protein B0919_21635 [Hymenobacter sp. CRA2]|nr:hypothetical protein B0919_21635 [Hymenobacter sp. CRA2]
MAWDEDDAGLRAALALFRPGAVARHALLSRQGEVCARFVFVTRGCLRFCYAPQGVDVSVWFSPAGGIGSDTQSFISQRPANFSVEAIEPTEYLWVSKATFETLCRQQPRWAELYRRLCEETIVFMIDRLVAFQAQTAEQRYAALLNDPTLLRRIPQKYLASYLGITPTSLSRLRRLVRTGREVAK